MLHCSLPYSDLVFCSHLQCVDCKYCVGEDGHFLGNEDVLLPPVDCRSLSEIRNDFAYKFRLLKDISVFVDSLITKANSL